MRAASASTSIPDPYRAGFALGESLASTAPEVVFLFSSVHYGHPPELLEGLHDGLNRDGVVVIGNSGDGCYETHRATDHGAAALGIDTGGKAKWFLATARGVTANPEDATRRAVAALRAAMGGVTPSLIYLAADFHADASRIETVLRDEIDVPVVGGFAADDNKMAECFLYANQETVNDAVVLLGVAGEVHTDISIGNALTAVGAIGEVEQAEGTQLHRIDGISAVDFIARETGKPVLQSDRGIVSLTIVDPEREGEKRLRAIVPGFSVEEGTLGLYGGIERGKHVQVCLANPESLIAEVYAMAERTAALNFEPKAAIIVSCAGRKWLLGGQIEHEVKALSDRFPAGLPIVGFPSFGEIGPLRNETGYTRNLFHNMTYVLLLVG
ncbi:MAG: FIST C-terminal domain-containing protein [Burkholderiales bacterium]|nr:FIST C-terminal domain-containing protein [Burkholderiales bacterium]